MENKRGCLSDHFPHLIGRKVLLAPGHVGARGEGTCNASGEYSEEAVNARIVADTLSVLEHTGALPFFMAGTFALKATHAEQIKPDAFIEVHCNGFDKPAPHGFEVWHFGDPQSIALAKHLAKRMLSYTPITCRGVHDMRVLAQPRDDWKQKHNALFRTVEARPLVLLETGFLTNPDDAAWLTDFDNHDRIASAIVHGLNDFFRGDE